MENNATQSKEEFLNRMILKLGAIIVDWMLSEKRKEGGPFEIFLENNSQTWQNKKGQTFCTILNPFFFEFLSAACCKKTRPHFACEGRGQE